MPKLKKEIDYVKWPTTIYNEDKIKALIFDIGLEGFAIYNYLTTYVSREIEPFVMKEHHKLIFAYDLKLDINNFNTYFEKMLQLNLFNRKKYEEEKIITNQIIEDTKESVESKRKYERETKQKQRENKEKNVHMDNTTRTSNNESDTRTTQQGQATMKVQQKRKEKKSKEKELKNGIGIGISESDFDKSIQKMNLHHFLESLHKKNLIPKDNQDLTTYKLINDKLFKLNETFGGQKVLSASYKVLATMRERTKDTKNKVYEPIKNLPIYLEKAIIAKIEEDNNQENKTQSTPGATKDTKNRKMSNKRQELQNELEKEDFN